MLRKLYVTAKHLFATYFLKPWLAKSTVPSDKMAESNLDPFANRGKSEISFVTVLSKVETANCCKQCPGRMTKDNLQNTIRHSDGVSYGFRLQFCCFFDFF